MADYFLKSQRLGFRYWHETDIGLAKAIWGDAQVTQFFSREPLSDDAIHQRLRLEINNQQQYAVQYWPIFLLEKGEQVGVCGLRPYKPDQGVFEIGVHIRPQYWRQGLAREAMCAVIAYAFNALGVKQLFAGHHPNNAASKRLLTSLGFQYSHDEYYAQTGLPHLSYYLSSDTAFMCHSER